MVGHTSGPWKAEICENMQEWEVVKYDPRKPTADEPWFVALCYDDPDGATAEDNARLIAAAPELLEALELVSKRCGPRSEDGKKARAAIAKARGDAA